MIKTQVLEEAVQQFEQCFSLDNFKTLQESSGEEGEKDDYVGQVKTKNKAVCEVFAEAEARGVEFLAQNLETNPNVDYREKVAVILGEVAKTYLTHKERIIEILRKRAEIEPERCILGRINYALQELEK
jgi:hypothetical protein